MLVIFRIMHKIIKLLRFGFEYYNNVSCQKRDRPIESKNDALCKKRGKNQKPSLLQLKQPVPREEITLKVVEIHEKINDLGNTKISINYCNDLWNRNKIIINDMFTFSVAMRLCMMIMNPDL